MKRINARNIRAARAALDWSRDDLAAHAGIAEGTIGKIEQGVTASSNARTIEAIENAFNRHGVFFTDTGVDFRTSYVRELHGDDYFIDVLDDIFKTLVDVTDGEMLSFGSDDRQNTPEINARLRKIANAGIKMRDLIEEGNTHMMGAKTAYRWFPKQYFQNTLKIVYGDKVFIDLGDSGVLLTNAGVAAVERELFDMLWGMLPAVDADSTATERF